MYFLSDGYEKMAESESRKPLRTLLFSELKEFNLVWYLLGLLSGAAIVLLFQRPVSKNDAVIRHNEDVVKLQENICEIQTTYLVEKAKVEVVYVEKISEIDALEQEFDDVEDTDEVVRLVSQAFATTETATDTQNALEAINEAFGGSSE